MIRKSSACLSARRDFLRASKLSAAQRSLLDIHLRRCESCRSVLETFKAIESMPIEIQDFNEPQKKAIYNELLPVINEIVCSVDAKRKPRKLRFPKLDTWIQKTVLAAAAAAVLIVTVSIIYSSGGPNMGDSENRAVTWQNIEMEGLVNRIEGDVYIDGATDFSLETFKIKRGTKIEVDKGARFSFKMGEVARLSVFSDTIWELAALTDKFLSINLKEGSIAVSFDGSLGKIMEVNTEDAIVRVKGTIFTVEAPKDGTTQVGVVEGLVEVVSKRDGRTISVAKGQLGSVANGGEIAALTDWQKSLAAEMLVVDYPEELTKLFRFYGTPEQVKIEVDGRVLGTSPLAVRLPDAPFTYRLTSPGMEPVTGSVVDYRHNGQVSYLLIPNDEFETVLGGVKGSKTTKRASLRVKKIKKADWDLFERARFAMQAGDLPFAIGLLEQAIEDIDGQKAVPALSLLAESYAAAGMYKSAVDTFDELIDKSGDTVATQNARYEVGRLSMDQLGDLSRARAAFTAYVASPMGGGLREEAYFSLCELDAREGSLRNALHCFNNFLRSFSDGDYEPEARLWRGALYQDMNKEWQLAEEDLAYFIKTKPRHPRTDEAMYRIILGRYQLGDRVRVLKLTAEYLKKHPAGQYRVRVERIRNDILLSSVSSINQLR